MLNITNTPQSIQRDLLAKVKQHLNNNTTTTNNSNTHKIKVTLKKTLRTYPILYSITPNYDITTPQQINIYKTIEDTNTTTPTKTLAAVLNIESRDRLNTLLEVTITLLENNFTYYYNPTNSYIRKDIYPIYALLLTDPYYRAQLQHLSIEFKNAIVKGLTQYNNPYQDVLSQQQLKDLLRYNTNNNNN